MTAKEYLSEIQKYRRNAEDLAERAEELRVQAEGVKAITYDKDRVQTSVTNRTEEIIAKLADVQEEYAQAIADYHAAADRREHQISQLSNPVEARVLSLKYCVGKSWDDIADAIGYTYRHTTRIHGEALQSFGELFADDLKCPKMSE